MLILSEWLSEIASESRKLPFGAGLSKKKKKSIILTSHRIALVSLIHRCHYMEVEILYTVTSVLGSALSYFLKKKLENNIQKQYLTSYLLTFYLFISWVLNALHHISPARSVYCTSVKNYMNTDIGGRPNMGRFWAGMGPRARCLNPCLNNVSVRHQHFLLFPFP